MLLQAVDVIVRNPRIQTRRWRHRLQRLRHLTQLDTTRTTTTRAESGGAPAEPGDPVDFLRWPTRGEIAGATFREKLVTGVRAKEKERKNKNKNKIRKRAGPGSHRHNLTSRRNTSTPPRPGPRRRNARRDSGDVPGHDSGPWRSKLELAPACGPGSSRKPGLIPVRTQ